MRRKKAYSQAARVQGVLRTLGARHGITIIELAEEFGVTKRTLYPRTPKTKGLAHDKCESCGQSLLGRNIEAAADSAEEHERITGFSRGAPSGSQDFRGSRLSAPARSCSGNNLSCREKGGNPYISLCRMQKIIDS